MIHVHHPFRLKESILSPIAEAHGHEMTGWDQDVLRTKVESWDVDPIPLVFGVAAVATPYVIGGAIVLFAPPWWKPVGAAMLVPSPMDAAYFGVGYQIGEHVEDWL